MSALRLSRSIHRLRLLQVPEGIILVQVVTQFSGGSAPPAVGAATPAAAAPTPTPTPTPAPAPAPKKVAPAPTPKAAAPASAGVFLSC